MEVSKDIAYGFCKDFVEAKAAAIRRRILSIQESLFSETKSSAGDKHETGRAMLHLELEKLGKQLQEMENMQRVVNRLEVVGTKDRVTLGSLVKTNKTTYYISIPAGRYGEPGKEVFCVSPNSPIAMQLLGKREGETFHFNGVSHTILQVS